MAIDCLPSEVLDSILQRLATQAGDPKLAAQDAACAAQVNKEWRAQVATRCWHVLLKKKLLIEVPCAADEALWLLHYLRGEQRPTIGFTAAKRLFKLNSRCLAPLSAIHHGPRQRRYKAGDLVELILKRHGSISAFREHVWKCTSVAVKAAKTSFERGVERRRLIDEAMAPFSNFIRRALHRQVEGYVKKNELSLDWIVKDASDMWWRQQDLDGMLHSMDLREARFLREDGLSYVKGNLSRGFVLQEIARHAALTEALQDKGLRVDLVHVRSGVCRTYVVAGGDLTTCVERALQPRKFSSDRASFSMHHFLTYGSGEPYSRRAIELAKSALDPGNFDSATICSKEDLDPTFCSQNQETLSIERGGGLWLFKPYIILKKLLSMKDGELLCYCDSLYLFRCNFKPFMDEWLAKGDVGIAKNKPDEPSFLEREFTKMDAFHIMNVPFENASQTAQAWGGFLLLRKSMYTVRFVSAWLTYCTDPRVLRNRPCILRNPTGFRAHREDQSVLSLLAKQWGIKLCDFPPNVLLNLRCPPRPPS